jgi:hypothetical protein
MRIDYTTAILAFAAAGLIRPAHAAVSIGQPAPAFSAEDTGGKTRSLADFRGRTVVLEWNNPGCPFVQAHYQSGAMQKAQAAAASQGVVWLTLNSGAPGKQGHMSASQANEWLKSVKATPAAYLIDTGGTIGKSYGATTTPHMFVINGEGRLVYARAIDDRPTADEKDALTAKNYVAAALADVRAGRPVATPTSKPYGCSVKY